MALYSMIAEGMTDDEPMSNQDILEKAIQKAIDGGLTGYWKERYEKCVDMGELKYLVDGNNIEQGETVEKLIFNHDFAKALWGGATNEAAAFKDSLDEWQYHLQQMVISDDPIKYLGENI